MRSKTLGLTLTAVMTAALGCAQVPTDAVHDAKLAIDGARNAQAQAYAADSWAAAVDSEAKLDAELAAQERRSPFLRSYGQAKSLAAETKEAADRAVLAATDGKQKTKDAATELMAEARKQFDAAKQELAGAPKGKGTEADLASLRADATPIETTLDEMQRAFDAGDYLSAKTKAEAAIDAAKRIRSEIEQAKKSRRAA